MQIEFVKAATEPKQKEKTTALTYLFELLEFKAWIFNIIL
jgi:hypothetical protein